MIAGSLLIYQPKYPTRYQSLHRPTGLAPSHSALGTRHSARGTRHAARGTRHAALGTRLATIQQISSYVNIYNSVLVENDAT